MQDSESDTAAHLEMYKGYVREQRKKLGCPSLTTVEVKVPTCGASSANSGCAALANCQWLLSSRKRAHPGAVQYLKQREGDYNKYSGLLENDNT